MSGAARRVSKGTVTAHPASAQPARPPDKADKPAADKRQPAKPAPRPAPGSPQAKGKRAGGAPPAPPANDACQDAIAEAQMLAEAVADNDEGNNKTTPPASPPHVPRKADSTVTLELNKVQAERAKLQADTERLRKELDSLVKEKKRKESVAAEPAPPAKRAVGSGRRSVLQSAAVSRKSLRHAVCTSILNI